MPLYFRGIRDIFLHSALDLVIVIEVAVLALALRIDQAVCVRACIGITLAAILVVAMIAHALGIVLLIRVGALQDLRGPSLQLLLVLRINVHFNF